MSDAILYKDIDLSFDKTQTGDFPVVTDLNSIRVSLYNTLFIRDNENFFEDDFGYSIEDFLFEFGDFETNLALQSMIENAVENDDRIRELEDLEINFNETTQEYTISLKLKLQNIVEPQEIDLILKKTR